MVEELGGLASAGRYTARSWHSAIGRRAMPLSPFDAPRSSNLYHAVIEWDGGSSWVRHGCCSQSDRRDRRAHRGHNAREPGRRPAPRAQGTVTTHLLPASGSSSLRAPGRCVRVAPRHSLHISLNAFSVVSSTSCSVLEAPFWLQNVVSSSSVDMTSPSA